MANQLEKYRDLMAIKATYDMVIATFHAYIDFEEARLNSSAMQSPGMPVILGNSVRQTIVCGGKRECTTLEESEESSKSNYHVTSHAKGEVEISDICADGKFVRLHNKGSKVS
jgi:lamin B